MPCRVTSRLLSHRVDTVGYRSEGNVSASAMSGIPRYVVLINWSKKLKFKVSFKMFFLISVALGMLVHEGRCVL